MTRPIMRRVAMVMLVMSHWISMFHKTPPLPKDETQLIFRSVEAGTRVLLTDRMENPIAGKIGEAPAAPLPRFTAQVGWFLHCAPLARLSIPRFPFSET